MRRWGPLLLVLWLATEASALELQLGVNDDSEAPWVLPSGNGLSQRLIAAAAARAGVAVRFAALPWQRALIQLEGRHLDGVVNASHTSARDAFARYPRDPAGAIDTSRRLHRESYALLRRRGDALDWDGTAFHGLTGVVCAQREFSIVAILRSHGLTVDDQLPDLLGNLEKLAAGRAQGTALSAGAASAMLRDHPELARNIEALPRPLAVRDYFLILAPAVEQRSPGLPDRLWSAIGELRAGPDYARWCAAAGAGTE
jgi:polar amino acid transport system substrate-binding protein